MARFELNIYGVNDEITNTYTTEHIRWGLLVKASDLQEEIKGADQQEQIKAVNLFTLELFPGMTEDELNHADAMDVMNVFSQVGKMANKLTGKNV